MTAGAMTVSLQAMLQAAESLAAAGRHAELLEATCCHAGFASPALRAAPSLEPARLHALRGRSHAQLGDLKQAVSEYSAAIRLLAGERLEEACHQRAAEPVHAASSELALLVQLLLARASLHEQNEALEAALGDADEAARLQRPPTPTVLLAVQRLRQACRCRAPARGV